MPVVVDVGTQSFEVAGERIAGDLGRELVRLRSDLAECLASGQAMAGSDSAGARWGASYDTAARKLLGRLDELLSVTQSLGAMLAQSGANHARADAASDPTRRAHAAAPRMAPRLSVPPLELPTTAGAWQSGLTPTGWELICHVVGYVYPNGHQDRLRKTGDAWRACAAGLRAASAFVGEARAALSGERSPEMSEILAVLGVLRAHMEQLGGAFDHLGAACGDFADSLDHARHCVDHELDVLVKTTVAVQVAGGLLSVFSFGAAEVAAQVAEGLRIAATAARVIDLIEALGATTTLIVSRVAALVTVSAEEAEELVALTSTEVRTAPVEVVETPKGTVEIVEDGAAAVENAVGQNVVVKCLKTSSWKDGALSQRHPPNVEALTRLAKAAKQANGISYEDAMTLVNWAIELGVSCHEPMIHPSRTGYGGTVLHINIGEVEHITVNR